MSFAGWSTAQVADLTAAVLAGCGGDRQAARIVLLKLERCRTPKVTRVVPEDEPTLSVWLTWRTFPYLLRLLEPLQ